MAEKILESLEIKTGENTSDKYIIPYNALANRPDLSVYAKLAGGNTFSGVQTVNAPANISGSEQATAKYKTANGGSITFGKEGANSGTMIRLDQKDGTCRLRFRSSATAGAMVWEQPEQGANLYIDLGKQGADYRRITMPSSSGTLALTSQIPSAVTESTVSGWGFTKNKGTVTSVAVKMNGSEKGNVTSSGTIDLGTVLTNASAFATSAQGTKADNAMPKSGGTFTGNISLPKELVFTDNTNPFIKMTTGGTDFYFQSTSGQFGLGPTWNKATHWDSNGNVTFPTTPKVGSSPLALKSDIPDVSGKANLSGGNTFTGNQHFNNGQCWFNGTLGIEDKDTNSFMTLDNNGFNLDVDGLGGVPFMIEGDAGTSGQVLTSQGAGKTPIWATPTSGGGGGSTAWSSGTSGSVKLPSAGLYVVVSDNLTFVVYWNGSGSAYSNSTYRSRNNQWVQTEIAYNGVLSVYAYSLNPYSKTLQNETIKYRKIGEA